MDDRIATFIHFFCMGILGLLLAACGASSSSDVDRSLTDPDSGSNEDFGLPSRPRLGTLNLPVSNSTSEIVFAEAFPGLPDFSQPVFLTHSGDGSDRLFVVEQPGVIKVFDNDPAATTVSVFLDIRAQVSDGGEMGLLGLAFDPQYANNGYFYVYYTDYSCSGGSRCSVLSRFTVSGNPDQADANSETVILRVQQPYGNHNGGTILFGPDGYLYWGLGDGGGSGDPDRNGQNTNTLLGALLRIDVRTLPYRIPADNPYTANSDGVRNEIWAYGLRNPYRFSFDRTSGRLWLADVGQNAVEEINVIQKGGNYGWNWYEGTREYRSGAPAGNYLSPVYEYDHSLGASVTGGYVYRGAGVPALSGRYVYGDFVSSRVWALSVDSNLNVTGNEQLGTAPQNVSSFGEDEAGELYILGYGGRIYRFAGGAPSDPLAGFPQWLSDTGLFASTADLQPASGLIPYDVAAPLWSDYSSKQRWIAVPNNQRITFNAEGAWDFPLGSVLVKHFGIEMVAGDPDSEQRLETRVLIRQDSGWVGATYRWNNAQTDAELLQDAASETITVADANFPNNTRTQTYHYPSPTQCLRCHTSAAGFVLGVRTRQLNSDYAYDAMTDNQLRSWNHIGLFTCNIGAASGYAAHANLLDDTASLQARSRAYLDSNCAFCHTPGGATPVSLNLNSHIALSSMNAIDVAPSAGDLGIANARIIAPGDHSRSVLWERMHTSDSDTRMPPIASVMADETALAILAQWIDSL